MLTILEEGFSTDSSYNTDPLDHLIFTTLSINMLGKLPLQNLCICSLCLEGTCPKQPHDLKLYPFQIFLKKILSVRYSLDNLLKIDFHKNNTFSILYFCSQYLSLFLCIDYEEGYFICPCYSLELCIQMRISFLFSLAFSFSSFLSYL